MGDLLSHQVHAKALFQETLVPWSMAKGEHKGGTLQSPSLQSVSEGSQMYVLNSMPASLADASV